MQLWGLPNFEAHLVPIVYDLVCVIECFQGHGRPLHLVELFEDAEGILKGAAGHCWRKHDLQGKEEISRRCWAIITGLGRATGVYLLASFDEVQLLVAGSTEAYEEREIDI